jgi:bis(5'-adenosyl)-triphosphatase
MNRRREIDCPFCEQQIKESTFAESANFAAIYNVAPILPGHSLVVPKWHVSSLLELSDSEFSEMNLFARKTVKLLLKVFEASAFDWTIQEGEEAGQTVSHLHLHLIPRRHGDLPSPGDWILRLRNRQSKTIDGEKRQKLTVQEMRDVIGKIKAIASQGGG